MVRRILLFVVTAVILYGVFPAILQVFGAWDQVNDVKIRWWVVMLVAQVLGLVCLWILQAIALHTREIGAVATSSLAGGALGRVIPGGAAATAALQYRMLTQAGIRGGAVATGLTASSLLLVGVLAGLPLLAVPFVVGGLRVPTQLYQATLLGLGVLVLLSVFASLLMWSDRVVRGFAHVVSWVLRRVRRDVSVDHLDDRLCEERGKVRRTLGARWYQAGAAAAGRWVFDFLTLMAALVAVGAQPKVALVLLAYVAAQLLAQVPLTPGGIGIVEAGMVGTLALAGVPAGAAAAATLAYRLVSYWLQLPAGAAAYVVHRRRYGDVALPEPAPS